MNLASQPQVVKVPGYPQSLSTLGQQSTEPYREFKHIQDSTFSPVQPCISRKPRLLSFSEFENAPQVLVPDNTSLEKRYSFIDKQRVLHFIERNRLKPLLQDSVSELRRSFGNKLLRLKIIEDDEGSETLYCLVVSRGSAEEARNSLRAFDESFWVEHSVRSAGKLNFDFELV